jgi:hypothetical protein
LSLRLNDGEEVTKGSGHDEALRMEEAYENVIVDTKIGEGNS